MPGILLKRELLEYLQDAKFEYKNKEQDCLNKITDFWFKNNQDIKKEDILYFDFIESNACGDLRFYITSFIKVIIFIKEVI